MGYWRPATCIITVSLALFAGKGCGANGSAKLSSAPAAPHSVALKWTASISPNVIGYKVYRTTSSSGKGRSKHPIDWQKITFKPVPETTYTDKSVLSRTTYYYAVTAVDSKGRESAFCQWVRATVP
jgi:fibronectin type 3 domain-containing protein